MSYTTDEQGNVYKKSWWGSRRLVLKTSKPALPALSEPEPEPPRPPVSNEDLADALRVLYAEIVGVRELVDGLYEEEEVEEEPEPEPEPLRVKKKPLLQKKKRVARPLPEESQ